MKSNYFNKNLLPNFKTLGLLFLTVLLFSACDDEPVPPAPGKKPAENLTFQKIYKAFATSGSFTTAEILAGVQGTKDGYTIKSISTVSPNDVASVTGSSLNMSKIEEFTATIVLQHNAKADATITGAEFQIYSDKLQVSNDGKVTLKSGVDKASITSMVIPAKMGNTDVTAIGGSAFFNCINLTIIIIPNSVTSIGNNAFRKCVSLTSITIPNSVTSIGNNAFERCTNLNSVTIGNSIKTIGHGVFSECTSLTSIKIPNSVTTIGNGVFSFCTSLTEIQVPSAKKAAWKAALKEGNTATVVGY